MSYLIGKLSGTRQCALCDISHGWNPRGKAEWREARCELPQVTWLHRDEQPEPLRKLTDGQLPAVVLARASEMMVLLDATALSGCEGDYRRFAMLLQEQLNQVGIGR